MEIVSTIGLITINATLFHQLIAFLIFLFIINRVMFRPLKSVMGEREDYMEKIKADTVDADEKLEGLLEDLKAGEAAVRAEAHEVRKELEESGGREAADILETTRQEIDAIKAKTERDIDAQVSESKKYLQQESETLSVTIMEKLLDRRLAP